MNGKCYFKLVKCKTRLSYWAASHILVIQPISSCTIRRKVRSMMPGSMQYELAEYFLLDHDFLTQTINRKDFSIEIVHEFLRGISLLTINDVFIDCISEI
jgi:hypothetical protein